jgi:hypothetical protein
MRRRISYEVVAYGEWTRPRMQNFREQCCDCGLIHRLDFRIVEGSGVSNAPRRPRDRRSFDFSSDE